MPEKQYFEEFYQNQVVQRSATYRAAIGPPVHLDQQAFERFLQQLKDFRLTYPNMAFWLVVDYKHLAIPYHDGDRPLLGSSIQTLRDFFRLLHPDYLEAILRWRSAAYELIHTERILLTPMEAVYRQVMPLKVKDGSYYWFSMNSTILQVDQAGYIVTNLQTFYREGKWSPKNLRPIEGLVQCKDLDEEDLHRRLINQMALRFIDEFTDTELGLLVSYATQKPVDKILQDKGWSRHTLHEYNANLLRKARAFFVYDFKNAREFAEFCLEKGYIRVP
ncbi:MAG: hypothetical protein EP344_07570 [Bacteroidetes bacterium]|nr:MAG: hypothetical protein EP344_07570 [Bacteroidota bacterium]